MIDLLNKLYPLHRTLVSDGTDKALGIVMDELAIGESKIEEYKVGSKVRTWNIPYRFHVNKAIL